MLIEPVILAAGYGIRLQSIVSDVPKPLADVNGRPFITYLFDQLIDAGFKTVVICIGHLSEKFPEILGKRCYGRLSASTGLPYIDLVYSYEREPMGPGATLKNAFPLIKSEYVLVLNGDTLVNINLNEYIQEFLVSRKVLSVVFSGDKNAGMYIIPSRFIANLNIEEPFHVYQAKGFLDIGTPETYKLAQELLK